MSFWGDEPKIRLFNHAVKEQVFLYYSLLCIISLVVPLLKTRCVQIYRYRNIYAFVRRKYIIIPPDEM